MGELVQKRSACPQGKVAHAIPRPSATPQLIEVMPPSQMPLLVTCHVT